MMRQLLVYLVLFVIINTLYSQVDSLLYDNNLLLFEKYLKDSSYTYRSVPIIDTASQRILLIGDSMVGGLSYVMDLYCKYNGHKFLAVSWESAQTYWFSRTDTLEYFINKFQPTYVFILLGSNEVYYGKDYEKKRSKDLNKIVKLFDSLYIPFIWLGPPNWNDDTAINTILRKYVGYDRFFPTYKISLNNKKFTRWHDKIHPAFRGDSLWMDSLATWLMNYSRNPIKMEHPKKIYPKASKNLIILKPLSRRRRKVLL